MALGTVAAALVSFVAQPADAKIVKKANVGATDPALGCTDKFGRQEVQSFANLDAAISGDVYLDLNNKVFYNEYSAQLRDALKVHFNRLPTCSQLDSVMASKPMPIDTLRYIACAGGAAAKPQRLCSAYAGTDERSVAKQYSALWLVNKYTQCGVFPTTFKPGRYVGFQQLNVQIGEETIIPILWSAKVFFRDVNIYQGLTKAEDNAPSQGVVVRAGALEQWLTKLQDVIVPRYQQVYGGDPHNNALVMAAFLIAAENGSYDANIRVGTRTLSQYMRDVWQGACAFSPTIQNVVDPNDVATTAAFDKSFRNLFDKLYNKAENPNVPIGHDVVCNPPGDAPRSGFCENLYSAFSGVATLGTAQGSLGWNCVKRNIGSLLSGDRPDFRNCA